MEIKLWKDTYMISSPKKNTNLTSELTKEFFFSPSYIFLLRSLVVRISSYNI